MYTIFYEVLRANRQKNTMFFGLYTR